MLAVSRRCKELASVTLGMISDIGASMAAHGAPESSQQMQNVMPTELKGQLLDIVGMQSNMQIFTAKYPKANLVCGMQVDGSGDLQWQCYGPDASKAEVQKALIEFVNEEFRYQRQLASGALNNQLYHLPKSFAKFNILRNFIDAAAMAGIVAGVQVTMLLELAGKVSESGMQCIPD